MISLPAWQDKIYLKKKISETFRKLSFSEPSRMKRNEPKGFLNEKTTILVSVSIT